MISIDKTARNRILVVDDDTEIVEEYKRCLGGDFDSELARSTLGDLEKVLFGEEQSTGQESARFGAGEDQNPRQRPAKQG